MLLSEARDKLRNKILTIINNAGDGIYHLVNHLPGIGKSWITVEVICDLGIGAFWFSPRHDLLDQVEQWFEKRKIKLARLAKLDEKVCRQYELIKRAWEKGYARKLICKRCSEFEICIFLKSLQISTEAQVILAPTDYLRSEEFFINFDENSMRPLVVVDESPINYLKERISFTLNDLQDYQSVLREIQGRLSGDSSSMVNFQTFLIEWLIRNGRINQFVDHPYFPREQTSEMKKGKVINLGFDLSNESMFLRRSLVEIDEMLFETFIKNPVSACYNLNTCMTTIIDKHLPLFFVRGKFIIHIPHLPPEDKTVLILDSSGDGKILGAITDKHIYAHGNYFNR